MGYIIKNTSGLINSQITDTGRKRLSEGRFDISYFQIGDSEVCYNCGNTIPLGNILEPNYNSQNSTGFPQSNKENVKYPYFLQGSSGNTYGIPADISAEVLIYNYTNMLGFFVSGTSDIYSANTTSAITITSNYVFEYSACTSGFSISLSADTCSPSTGTPQVNQFITLYFDGNKQCGVLDNFPILTYQITGVSLSSGVYTVSLDRNLPNYTGCSQYGRAIIYPSGMTVQYDVTVPSNYFADPCAITPQVNIWNMNIPWSVSPAGLLSTIYADYTKFGSVDYLGSKEYLGYQTDNAQYFINSSGTTGLTDTYYTNSLGYKINVLPSEQKAIAIVSYTNQSINNYYGEKFAVEPYDPSNPGQEGQARNLKVVLPTLMWHKSTGGTIGETFYIDPPGFDVLTPSYMESTVNSDFNQPGMRYYHLWDTYGNTDGKPNRVGKVYPDSKLVVFDDEEIIAAMSYKANRNWTLPAPQLNLIAPNQCTPNIDSVGFLTSTAQTIFITYRFDSTEFTESLHCNYYSKIQGPSDPTLPMNVSIRFGNEFPFMTQGCSGFSANSMKFLIQTGTTGNQPIASNWLEIDVTSELISSMVNGYLTASGISNNTFVVSLNDITGATQYNLSNYINLPLTSQNDLLNFGDEYFFYGNFISDIQGTIYEMKYAINLQNEQFTNTSNPTKSGTTNTYVTEIGLYNFKKELMILSKLQYPVLRQGLQQFLVKYDF